MKVSVQIVNSFVANNNGGNPAGVVLNSDSLSSHQMLKIAKQVGLSETAFVGKSKSAELELKFFTPVDEVDLCGHATIASWFTMFSNGEINPGQHTQLTRSGKLKIVVEQSGMVSMELAKPIFGPKVPAQEIANALGVDQSSLSQLQPEVVSVGLPTLIVELKSKDLLMSIDPDIDLLKVLGKKYGFLQIHPFVQLPNTDSFATGRDFGPTLGVVEESATGTANGALVAFLKSYNMVEEGNTYRFEQGENMGQLSYLFGKIDAESVWVGGESKITGDMEIDIS